MFLNTPFAFMNVVDQVFAIRIYNLYIAVLIYKLCLYNAIGTIVGNI